LRRIRLSRFRLFGFWPYSIVRLRRSFRRGNADHHTVQRDRNHVRFHSGHCSTLTLNGSVAIDRAARLAAIPAGESPANRGVQSLL